MVGPWLGGRGSWEDREEAEGMAGSEDDEVKGREVKDLAGDPTSLETLRGPDPEGRSPG